MPGRFECVHEEFVPAHRPTRSLRCQRFVAARVAEFFGIGGSRIGGACRRRRSDELLLEANDDATKLGVPKGFRITVNEVYGSAGAGFVVAKAGDIMTMPGLSKTPSAEGMRLRADGTIEGLS